jgi:hypothetical protein
MKLRFILLFLIQYVIILVQFFVIKNYYYAINKQIIFSSSYNKIDRIEEFKLIHKNIIQNKTKEVKVSINGPTPDGYANKLYSMLSSMVIAILTDSALIIRWPDIDTYIQEPLYKSFSKEFDLSEQNELNANYKQDEVYSPQPKFGWIIEKNMSILIRTKLPSNKNRFSYKIIKAYFYELCSNPIYYKKLTYYNLVDLKTIGKALDSFNSNSNKEMSNEILKIGFEVGGNLLNKLWIPNQKLLNKINYYYKNHFENNYVIGIQFRSYYLKPEEDFNVFIDCALELEKHATKAKAIKWFVTSDSNEIIQQILASNYKEKLITTNETIGHIEKGKNFYERTILDNELLSKCDEIIITGGSTFGFIASMKRLKLPYYVNGQRNMKKCRKTELSEPPLTPGFLTPSTGKGHSVF